MFPDRRRKECGPVIRWCFLPVYQFEGKQPSFSLFLVFIADAFPPNGTVQCRTEEHKQVCLTWPPQATRALLHSGSTLPVHCTLKPFRIWWFLVKPAEELWILLRQYGGNLLRAARMAIQLSKVQHLSFSFHIKAMKNRKGENDSSVWGPGGTKWWCQISLRKKQGGYGL